jgi:prepilin-type N-terminal cleavage/methylation domain-containing protein
MKKNGFTLVELLGVVTILSLLGLIIVPTITGIISSSKEKIYDTQINNIKSSTSNFVSENVFSLDIPSGGSIGIKLGKLKELGYIDNEIKNPITKEEFSNDMVVVISNNGSSYSYTVCDEDTLCDSSITLYGE